MSLFPQCILEGMMMMMITMTSLLADKSVMIKIKIMNFMNEIINPICNNFLATFFEAICEVCPKTVLAEITSSPVDNKSAVQAAVSPSPFVVPGENVAGERGEESPVGGPGGLVEVGGVCEIEASTKADAEEDEGEDVDVVGGVDEDGLSGYESEGFTLSEILRRKRLGKNVSEGVVDTAHLPQYEFSNLHRLSLALLFRICLLASQSFQFGLVLLRALEYEDDLVRLLCFSVQSLRRTSGSW